MQQIIVIVFAGGTVCEAFHILECNTNMVCRVSQRDRVSIGLEKVHIRGVWQKGLRPGQSDDRGSRGVSERCVAASHKMKSLLGLQINGVRREIRTRYQPHYYDAVRITTVLITTVLITVVVITDHYGMITTVHDCRLTASDRQALHQCRGKQAIQRRLRRM
jgi:hypothetical protein